MGCMRASRGIRLLRGQPYASSRSAWPSFPIISLIRFGVTPSKMPTTHRAVIVASERVVVTKTGYLLRKGEITMKYIVCSSSLFLQLAIILVWSGFVELSFNRSLQARFHLPASCPILARKGCEVNLGKLS